MMEPKTPGVYLREVDVAPPGGLPMSITGFVGQAERGPLNYPQPLTNWGQFRSVFGDFKGYSYMAYAVFGFFLNGGERCYVVRVADERTARARLQLSDAHERSVFALEAIDEGEWGNSIEVSLEPRSTDFIELTTLVNSVEQGASDATFASVAGLDAGDEIRLIHPQKPVQEALGVETIDRESRHVTFRSAVITENGFTPGATVMAPGFKLTIAYKSGSQTVRREVFDNLAMDPGHPHYFVALINGDPEERDYVKRSAAGLSLLVRAGSVAENPARPQAAAARLIRGNDGPPNLKGYTYYTGYDASGDYIHPVPPDADPDTRKALAEQRFGLAAFEAIGEIGLVVIPDLVIPDLYAAIPKGQIPKEGILFANFPQDLDLTNLRLGQEQMLQHCQGQRERFAILDSPPGSAVKWGANPIERWPDYLRPLPSSPYGALYYPWVRERPADFGGRDLLVPPSGQVAGVYARTEAQRGAGKAPANEVLLGAVALEFAVGDVDQAALNERGVNCIRSFPTRGIRIWGARTLSTDPAWRYVNVRRVALLILKTILVGLQWSVFEPNDGGLRNRIATTLTSLLRDLYQSGALLGASPAEAFYVRCDETNNPQDEVDEGQIVAEVGFALARPAEFIVVTVKRTTESVSVSEAL